MAALTLQIVGRALLGLDLAGETSSVRDGLESALTQFTTSGGRASLLGRSRGPAATSDSTTAAPVHALVEAIIEERARNPSDDRADVVSALLASEGLTRQEVHDNVITLLMAGHETTANALSWTLYLLGRHREVQQRLQAEVDTLDGRLPAVGDIAALPYARAVISEAIRRYPPAWIIGRTLTAQLQIAGYTVPPGSVVAISPLLLHHDARWFPEPEVFDPERWLDGRRDALPRYAYLPFGTGPRSCIGEQFAWIEAITVLAVFAQSWTAEVDAGHVPRAEYRVTLRPAGGLPITVRGR